MGTKHKSKTSRAVAPRSQIAAAPAASRTSLADALFSTTQQRVLGLLFGQPERSFFATELINLAASGSGAVQRELSRLVESGLVAVTHIGKQKHYQANPEAPVFEELRQLVMKTGGLIEPLRSALLPLSKNIRFAAVYGSVAKAQAGAGSDVDLLVVADGLTLEELFATLQPVEKKLHRAISPTLYTSAEFIRRRKAGNAFITKVLAGKHILLIGSEDAIRTTG